MKERRDLGLLAKDFKDFFLVWFSLLSPWSRYILIKTRLIKTLGQKFSMVWTHQVNLKEEGKKWKNLARAG